MVELNFHPAVNIPGIFRPNFRKKLLVFWLFRRIPFLTRFVLVGTYNP